MPVSDAEFDLWAKQAQRRVVLAEIAFAYESGGVPATGTLYLSSRRYATKDADSPPHRPYKERIRAAGYRRGIDLNSLGGKSRKAVSDLKLANADGALDFMLDLAIDGQEVKFYVGGEGWARSDFRHVLTAIAENAKVNDREVVVKLRDKRLLVDREIKGDPVGGSGPDASKYLPLLWGSHFNVRPLVYDASTLVYACVSNYGAAARIVDVRDKGVSLRDASGGWGATAANTTVDTGTNVFTYVGHGLVVDDVIFFADPIISGDLYSYWAPFAGMSPRPYWVKTVPTADTFTLSETKGGATLDVTGSTFSDSGSGFLVVVRQRWMDADIGTTGRIQISGGTPEDLTFDIVNQGNQTAPFALAKSLIETYGNVSAADIDAAAFTAADVALDAKVSVGYSNLSVMDRQNLGEVLDRLLDSVFGWWDQDNVGRITCGLVDPSGIEAATATRELAKKDFYAGLECENLTPTISRANVKHGVNHTPQAGTLASTVTVEKRALYKEPYTAIQRSTAPSGTAYATNRPLYHKLMSEAAPDFAADMGTSGYGSDTALPMSNYSDEIVEDRRPHMRSIRGLCGLDKYAWNPGEVVNVTYPRMGFAAGKKCRLMGVDVELVASTVGLDLLGYFPPDVATGSY